MDHDFVFVDELIPGIRWDAKYATWDNFTGKPIDGYLANRIVGSRALCAALEGARHNAASVGLGLLLWDGYRPQRAVDCFLRWSQQPEDGRTKGRHYPNIDRTDIVGQGYVAANSGHSRGSAVDLTLFDLATDSLVLMGGIHDLMDAVSHHEARGLTPVEASNRRALRSIMETSGFDSFDREWWHYSLTNEPYPDMYFDFPVGRLRQPEQSGTGMLDQRTVSSGFSGGGAFIAGAMPSASVTRHHQYATVSDPSCAIERGDAVRVTRALSGE